MIRRFWVRNILGRWRRRVAFGLLIPWVVSGAGAPSLESLGRAYREKPTPARRAALMRFAAERPKEQAGALALLAAGIGDVERGEWNLALRNLRQARARLPVLADYSGYYAARALVELHKGVEAELELQAVSRQSPRSPWLGKASLLAAVIAIHDGRPEEAIRRLRGAESGLPQPKAELLMAQALELARDPEAAARSYQTVYYRYPMSAEAAEAGKALARLQAALAERYPPVTGQTILERARILMEGGQHRRARGELLDAAARLAGLERDLAHVRVGAADHHAGLNQDAWKYLRALEVRASEADAERLYYVVACSRRLNNRDAARAALEELNRKHPSSEWRRRALVVLANSYLIDNDAAAFEPLYRACYESFPAAPEAFNCHWKVAWQAYLHRRPEAERLLAEHLERFPSSSQRSAALYFLGRAAEARGELGTAKAYYLEITRRFPKSYYTLAARTQLESAAVARAPNSDAAQEFLQKVGAGAGRETPVFEPAPAMRRRLARARLLASAGLDDLSEEELGFGAVADGQPHVAAMELAAAAMRRGQPERAIRFIKRYVPNYLELSLEDAPESFWRLAFPLPYRSQLERHSARRSLDLFLLAGLIRQESEFNPRAVSRARAMGLTQVLPSTGRQLSRKLGPKGFRPFMLLQPEVNLNMGSYYFRSMLDELSGRVEVALAAYNAGKRRAVSWLGWGEFREPAEYIETIPLTETRTYVQVVLRNAEVYRRLYSASTQAAPPARLAPSAKARQPAAKKRASP